MPSRSLHLTLLLGLCLFLNSCSNQGMAGNRQVIDGIEVQIYREDAEVPIDPYLVEEGVVFGVDQSEDTYLLSRPFPKEIGRDGTLYVIDYQESVVHRFAPDGSHLGQFGRRGDGPGEFRLLQELIAEEDRLYIPDFMRNHVMITALDGTFIENIPVADREFCSPGVVRFGPGSDRRYLVKRTNYSRAGIEIVDPFFRVTRWSETLDLIDTPIDTVQTTTAIVLDGNPILPPYSTELPVVASGTDMPLAWSYQDEFRIDFMDPVDLTRWAVIIPSEKMSVTSAMKERFISGYERRGIAEQVRRSVVFPDHLPLISSMIWDRSGRLWVLVYRDPVSEERTYTFHVFSREGHWLFQQQLPSLPRIITEHGYYGTATLEDGSPVIQYHELRNGTGR